MTIREEFELGIDRAETQVTQLEAQLTDAFGRAGDLLGRALNDAIANVGTDATVDVSVAAPDATPITDAIDQAAADADAVVTPEVDTSGLQEEVEAAVSDADATVDVEANGPGPEAAQELANIGNQAEATGRSVDGLGIGMAGLGVAASGASGNVAGVGRSVTRLSGEIALGVGALTTITGAAQQFFDAALDDVTATERLDNVFGQWAGSVNRLDLVSLGTDLDGLTLKLGSADEKVRNAAAGIGLLGQQSGQAPEQIARTTQELVALSARAVAVNPQLGEMGDVMDRMLIGLSRGGRFAAQFGLNLAPAEINARALGNTLKTNVADLTLFERAQAGAQIATEKLGASLGTDIERGSQQAVFQLRQVKEQLARSLEATGMPLLQPIIEFLRQLEPEAELLAEDMGQLLVAIIPVATALVRDLHPALAGTSGLLQLLFAVLTPVLRLIAAVPAPVFAAVGAYVALQKVVALLADTIAARGNLTLAGMVAGAAGPIAVAAAAVAALITVVQMHNAEKAKAKQATDDWTEAIRRDTDAVRDNTGAISENVDELIRQRFQQHNQLDDLSRLHLTFEDVRTAVSGTDADFLALLNTIARTGEFGPKLADGFASMDYAMRTSTQTAINLNDGNVGLFQSLLALRAGAQSGAAQARDLANAEDDATGATKGHADAADLLNAAIGRLGTNQQRAAALTKVLLADLAAGTLSMQEMAAAAELLGTNGAGFIEQFGAAVADATLKVVADLTSHIPAVADAAISAMDSALAELEADAAPDRAVRRQDQLASKLADIQDKVASDMAGFDRSVRDSVAGLADSWGRQIPAAGQVLDNALQEIDTLFQEQKRRQETLAADFRTPLGDDPVVVLPDLTALFQKQIGEITAFFDTVDRLAAAGLDRTVQLLLEKGPEAGAALATALAGATGEQQAAFESTLGQLDQADNRGQAMIDRLVGELPAGTAAAAEAASKAFEQKFDLAAPAGAEIGELREVFKRELEALATEAGLEAQAAADATTEPLTKVKDRVADSMSLRDVLAQLDRDAAALGNFYNTVERLTSQGLDDTAALLLEKGPVAGAKLAELLANADDAQRRGFEASVEGYNRQADKAAGIVAGLATRLPPISKRVADEVTKAFDEALNLAGVTGADADAARALLRDKLSGAPALQDYRQIGNAVGTTIGSATHDSLLAGLGELAPLFTGALTGTTVPAPPANTTLIPGGSVGTNKTNQGFAATTIDQRSYGPFVLPVTEPETAGDSIVRGLGQLSYSEGK